MALALAAVVGACGSTELGGRAVPGSAAPDPIIVPPASPAALILVVDPRRTREAADLSPGLLSGTARTAEHVTVLVGDHVILSSTSPAGSLTAPSPIEPVLPAHATSYQRSKYDRARRQYDDTVNTRRNDLLNRQQGELHRWSDSLRPSLSQLDGLPASVLRPQPAFVQAQASLASLAAAGVELGSRKLILVLGGDAPWLASPQATTGSLQGATVVVAQFAGGPDEAARVQSRLVQAGAGRAVVLTPSSWQDVQPVVAQALAGPLVETVPTVPFALGSAALSDLAEPALRQLSDLLNTSHPTATAVINGYTDSLGSESENVALAQQRADAVKAWLVMHGVMAERLQALGHGALDPAAPNGRSGQPDNRRVVTVINPTS